MGSHVYKDYLYLTICIWQNHMHETKQWLTYFPVWQHRECVISPVVTALQRRHNERDHVSNHKPHDCLCSRLFRRRSKKTSKLRVTGLCVGNSPGTGEFPAQMTSNAENVSFWWRHHVVENINVTIYCLPLLIHERCTYLAVTEFEIQGPVST